jgi:putative protease
MVRNVLQFQGGVIFLLKSANLKIIQQIEENVSNKRVELMTPLKNYKSLKAVLGKADAVYFGIESFNMRMYSDNLKLEDLSKIVKTCHSNNTHAYLTTNVVIYENEFPLLDHMLDKAVEAEIDAVIVHDIGAINLAQEKGLNFHISTQANISNSRAAAFYESLGAQRLILARELSLEQIKEIKDRLIKAGN